MMRKLVFLLVCLLACVSAYALDVIVMADGTTISAKVLNVSATEVQYKKASNLTGPTYTVPVSSISSITYENGERDTFGAANAVTSNYNPNIVTNETATQFSDDQRLLSMYYRDNKEINDLRSKAKKWKTAGIVCGAVGVIGASLVVALGMDLEAPLVFSCAGAGLCVVGGVTCFLIGNHYSKKAKNLERSFASVPVWETEFDFAGGRNLRVGVDVMSYQMPNSRQLNPGLGLGLRYSF